MDVNEHESNGMSHSSSLNTLKKRYITLIVVLHSTLHLRNKSKEWLAVTRIMCERAASDM